MLEGSVRAAGNRIRVTAQLIDGESGYHLWSQHYDRRFEDLFELQDELANAIILQALETAIDGSANAHREPGEPPTRNLDAYLLYLSALSDGRKGILGAQAFEKLQAALRLDPGFARARALMAEYRSLSLLFGVPLPGTLADAEQGALRALQAAPDSASAHAAVGVFHAAQGRWLDAHARFQRAKELALSEPDLWMGHAVYVLGSVGHLRANAASSLEALRLAPAMPLLNMAMAVANALMGNDDEVRRLAGAAVDLGAQLTTAPLADALSQVELRAKHFDAACRLIHEPLAATPGAWREAEAVELVFHALAGSRDRSAAVHALDTVRGGAGFAAQPHFMRRRMIVWYAMLDAYDQAFEVMQASLDEFAETGTIGVAWSFLWLPELAGFREDPRFGALARRMNFTEFWEKHGPPDGYDWRDGRLIAL